MNRVLIDTNVLVHLLFKTLDDDTDALVRDYSTQVYISSTSVKEFIHLVQTGRIKTKTKKLEKKSVFELLEKDFHIEVLYTTKQHLEEFEKLPSVPNHNDPNDRLIISQALSNRLELVSSDLQFVHYRKYGLEFIKAKHTANKNEKMKR